MVHAAMGHRVGPMSPIDRIAYLNRWRHRSLAEKALFALGLMAVVLTLPPFPVALMAFALAVSATILGAGVPARLVFALIVAPLGFLVPGALMLTVTVTADGIGFAEGGLRAAGDLMMRAAASTAALIFLATTTPAPDIVRGLLALKVPRDLIELALAIYRFIAVLAETASHMHAAQTARLGGRTVRTRIRSLGLLVAQLWPRALARAHALEVGLAARGTHDTLMGLAPRHPINPVGLGAAAAAVLGTALVGWVVP